MKGKLSAVTVAFALAFAATLGGLSPAAASPKPAAPPRTSAAAPSGAWTTYHRDAGKTGYDPTIPQTTTATAGWVSPTLDETVYDEPLVYNGMVYVGTSNNTVYALNQGTGAIVWSQHLGAPQTGGWSCGNVNPTGILGTGVIDVALSRVFFVAFLSQYLYYYLYGFDLATGAVKEATQIAPGGFDWKIQQERGALALSADGSHVYVPFGGRAGDCGPYHGWVVGVPTTPGVVPDELYQTPSTGEGVWDAGGVVVDGTTGNVFFSTGNAIPCSGAINSDSVIRTGPTLGSATSFFQPSDWQSNWCAPDLDLGSAAPVMISPSLMFMAGKYGSGFLLNPGNLGGTGNGLFRADICHGIHSDATFGSFAYAAPYVYVECDGGGLVALQVNASTPSFSQCAASCIAPSWWAGGGTTFGPPIVAGGVVWVADIGGGGLFGFNATTGAQVYHSAGFPVDHFTTPSEAGGQIFVSADTQVRSFNMAAGCQSVSVTLSPASPSVVGTLVTVTAAAAGCPNPNPQYEFWLLPPGGTWRVVRPYSTISSFGWDTRDQAAGTYLFSVWARDASSSSSYDAYDSSHSYTLTAGHCSSIGVSLSPASPQSIGTPVTVSATSSGCPNPRYQFWLLPPGGAWTVVQPYGTAASFSWSTVGRPAGSYLFSVWVRDASSPAGYDAYDSSHSYTLTVTPCTGVGVSISPASPQSIGTPVTVNATPSGCPNARYQFWLLPPGGTWSIVQPYSSSASFNWSTAGRAAGSYLFSVWVRDLSSQASYDAYDSSHSYTLTVVPCTGVNVTISPASPQTVGTPVTVGATASGCSNPRYQFWLLAPGGTWTVVQPYGSSPTFTWSTVGRPRGTYLFSVWARDLSSQAAYDAYDSSHYYTLS